MKTKLFKKVICLILTLSLLIATSSQLIVSASAYAPEDHTVSGSQIRNEYLRLYVNGSNSISYYTVEGDPSTDRDNNKQLLYNGTSITYINVNGSISEFYANGTKLSEDGNSMYSWYNVAGVQVERIMSFQYNTYTGRNDIVEFKYILTNTSENTQSVGARIMFDTKLGDIDHAPFKVNGKDVTTQTEFVGDAIPQVWQVFDNLTSPTVVGSGTFYNNISERPDKVQFNNWGNSNDLEWNSPCFADSSIGDSAVNIFYNPIDLAPGESRTVKTVYGISQFTPVECNHRDADDNYYCDNCGEAYDDGSDFEPVYSFVSNFMAPATLVANAQTNTYDGNPFSFNGWIENNGNVPLENVNVKLHLPYGLSASDGTEIYFSSIGVGEATSLFWNIEVADQYVETTFEYRIEISADNAAPYVQYFNITVPALEVPCNHSCGYDFVIDVNPTCTAYGMGHYVCSDCGEYMYDDYAPALGHEYMIVETFYPTCTADGYTRMECQRAGCDSEKIQPVPALDHDFDANYICRACGFVLDRHTHDYTVTVIDPTCTAMGYTLYECVCGYSFRSEYIDMLGHRWDDGVVTVANTCTTPGTMLHSCVRCDASYETVIPAGHSWSETVTTEATCTTDGLITRTCYVCYATETEVIPAGHKWDDGVVVTEPTCETAGLKICTCQVCFATESFEIKRLGHNYYDGYCQRCGEKFSFNIIQGDHPEYGMYFEIEDIVSNYGPDIINEYGLLLDYNAGARFDKVAIYITQEGNLWRRCIACVGENIEYATYVPYLSYGDDIKYTGLNSPWINTFSLRENADGIWCYSNYATIGVNLEDNQGNLLLSLYDIGQAGTETRIFDDLSEMIAWLKGADNGNCAHESGRWVVAKEPTYTTTGLRVKRCVECDAIMESEVIPVLTAAKGFVNTDASYAVVDRDIVFTLTIQNCDLANALAIVPKFDADYFELVYAEWLIEAPVQNIEDGTNRAISAFGIPTDVNTVVFTFTLRAKAPITSTTVGCALSAEIGGKTVTIYVEACDIAIILCDHPEFDFVNNGDAACHDAVCTVCGYTTVAEHTYSNACDAYCDGCNYERVAPHAYSEYYVGDEFGHWHECVDCYVVGDIIDHTYDNAADGECNDCGYVRFIRGDVDGDGDVDSDDTVRIIYYIFFGEASYPVNQSIDFNGDGEDTTDDAVYLLYHIFYNDLYPLY